MLVIHPKDKTTAMLSALYDGLEAQVVADYLPNQGMPSMELVAGKEVKKSFFLKVWWNHFVTFVNEKL